MKALFDDKRLAIVEGVGFAQPNYSHFESMDIWQSAEPTSPVGSGWLGAGSTRPARTRCARWHRPDHAVALTGAKVQGRRSPPASSCCPVPPASRPSTPPWPRRLGRAPRCSPARRALTHLLVVDRTLGPILNRTVDSDPLHVKASDSVALAGSSAAALAIANGGGGLSSGNVLATQLSIVAKPDPGRCGHRGLQRRARRVRHACGAGEHQSELLTQLDTGVSAFVDAVGATERGRDGGPRLHRVSADGSRRTHRRGRTTGGPTSSWSPATR